MILYRFKRGFTVFSLLFTLASCNTVTNHVSLSQELIDSLNVVKGERFKRNDIYASITGTYSCEPYIHSFKLLEKVEGASGGYYIADLETPWGARSSVEGVLQGGSLIEYKNSRELTTGHVYKCDNYVSVYYLNHRLLKDDGELDYIRKAKRYEHFLDINSFIKEKEDETVEDALSDLLYQEKTSLNPSENEQTSLFCKGDTLLMVRISEDSLSNREILLTIHYDGAENNLKIHDNHYLYENDKKVGIIYLNYALTPSLDEIFSSYPNEYLSFQNLIIDGKTQWKGNYCMSPVIECATKAFQVIPDHVKVADEAKKYMTEDLYNALSNAYDVPIWVDGEIGEEEFLSYFVTGNGGTEIGEVQSATITSIVENKCIVEIKYALKWSFDNQASSIRLAMIKDGDNWLLDDFCGCWMDGDDNATKEWCINQNKKKACIEYIKKEISDFKSGKTTECMKEQQNGEWYTDEYINNIENAFNDYIINNQSFLNQILDK